MSIPKVLTECRNRWFDMTVLQIAYIIIIINQRLRCNKRQ